MDEKLVICEWTDFCKEENRFRCTHTEVHNKQEGCNCGYCLFWGYQPDENKIGSCCMIIDDQLREKRNGKQNSCM